MNRIHEVDPYTLKNWLDRDEAVLIDVREDIEHTQEAIPGAIRAPLSRFNPGEFGVCDKPAVFHCATGRRTQIAASLFHQTGCPRVYHLRGGIFAWKMAGLPVIRGM
jgi:rhodanese-related sulfurtransferase